jgi:hypothetical protein
MVGGAPVEFATAEECFSDPDVTTFSCPSRGKATMDLTGTPFVRRSILVIVLAQRMRHWMI